MKPQILVIDDETAVRDSLKMILEYRRLQLSAGSKRPGRDRRNSAR